MLSNKCCCSYCLEVDQKSVVRSWGNGCHQFEISGCSSCHERHEKQVLAREAEVTDLKVALAKRKANHDTERIIKRAKSSSALNCKMAKCEELLLEVNELKAENNSQRSKVEFLQLRCDSLRGNAALPDADLHAFVLVAKSPVLQRVLKSPAFQKLLETETAGELIKEFTSDEITTPVFEATTDFCHSGELTFTELVPPGEVLRAAHTLEIVFLRKVAEAELCRRLKSTHATVRSL